MAAREALLDIQELCGRPVVLGARLCVVSNAVAMALGPVCLFERGELHPTEARLSSGLDGPRCRQSKLLCPCSVCTLASMSVIVTASTTFRQRTPCTTSPSWYTCGMEGRAAEGPQQPTGAGAARAPAPAWAVCVLQASGHAGRELLCALTGEFVCQKSELELFLAKAFPMSRPVLNSARGSCSPR